MVQYLAIYSADRGGNVKVQLDYMYMIDVDLSDSNLIKIAESINNILQNTYELNYTDKDQSKYIFVYDELKRVLDSGSYYLGSNAGWRLYPVEIRMNVYNSDIWGKLSNIITTGSLTKKAIQKFMCWI